jgi:succinate dehydrogenase / fumarate reductase cytochrome b subunit
MSRTTDRPLSPHLTIWRWGPGMMVSILHRLTGAALTIAGLAVLTWFLMALAGSEDGFAAFVRQSQAWYGMVVLVGLTWAFWQHTLSGLRHLVLDTGAGYELRINRFFSVMTIVGAVFLTALTWAIFEGVIR